MSYFPMIQIGEGYENGHGADESGEAIQLADSSLSGRAATVLCQNSQIQDQALDLTKSVSGFLLATIYSL